MAQNKEGIYLSETSDFKMSYMKTEGAKPLYMLNNHYHKSYEIYYLLSGEKYYFIKDKTYHIKEGDIVLINSYDLHRTSLVKNHDSERILVALKDKFIDFIRNSYPDMDLMACFKKDMPVLRLKEEDSAFIKEHLYKMLNLYNKNSQSTSKINELYLKILSIELLILLNKFADYNEPEIFEHPSIVHKKISDAIIFINKNYMNEHSLESISTQFHISKFYFARLFKEITGLTFIDYLNIIRLKAAQKLLTTTDFSISRISNEVGYSDASYFCRVFKRYCNYSPVQYRKRDGKEA